VVIQNISASFSELFPNYVPPVPLCLEKWGVMTPQLLWERRPCMHDAILLPKRAALRVTYVRPLTRTRKTVQRSNLKRLPASAVSDRAILRSKASKVKVTEVNVKIVFGAYLR